jgi:hypothetical protein
MPELLMKPMPDDPTDPDPHLLDDATDAEIEAALAEQQGLKPPASPLAPEVDEKEETEPSSETKPELAAGEGAGSGEESATGEGEAPPAQGEEAPPELDEVAIAQREGEIERQKLREQLELQKAHNARMAGELGHIKQLLKSEPRQEPERDASEVYGGDGELGAVIKRLDQVEGRLQSEARTRAIQQELETMAQRPELKEITETQLQQATSLFQEEIKAIREIEDPTIARQMTKAVLGNVVAEARGIALAEIKDKMRSRSVTQKADLLRAKRDSAPPTSVRPSGVARPKAKTLDQMSDAEIEKMTDEAISRSA